MALTKIDVYEVMYSANKFALRIWLKGGGKISASSSLSRMDRRCLRIRCLAAKPICITTWMATRTPSIFSETKVLCICSIPVQVPGLRMAS